MDKEITEKEFDEFVQERVDTIAVKTIEEKVDEILKSNTDTYIKDQLDEHMKDALTKYKEQLKLDPEVEAAQKKADQFQSGGEFLKAVRIARDRKIFDPRLTFMNDKGAVTRQPLTEEQKTAGHMEIGDDSQGGFLVPEVYQATLYEIALETAIVRPNGATILPMTSDSLKIPTIVDTTHATTVYGGVQVLWTGENVQKTPTKPAFGQFELTPHKLAGMTFSSNELLDDSMIALETLITRMFGSSMGYFEDDAFLQGTGAGQPLGIINCNCTINNFRETTNAVTYQDIVEMWSRLLPGSHDTAVWVINPEVLPHLMQIGAGVGALARAAGMNLIWINRNMGAASPIPGTIFGRPFFMSEKMSALGTAGDIGLYDMKYYLIGDRQRVTIDASTHLRFDYDETAWRFVLRVAGMCWPQSAITPRRGTATRSPFVQLHANTS